MEPELSRRQFLGVATGALVVAFGLPCNLAAQSAKSLRTSGGPLPPNELDSWLVIDRNGMITVMTGKVELGTGVSTSLRQIVAEELDYPFEKINWIQGDTANTVDQAPTFGSQTIKRGGSQLRQAAAEARATLLSLAATHLGVPLESLTIFRGVISAANNATKKITFADLLGGTPFNREVTGKIKPKEFRDYKVVGQSIRRVELPAKIAGEHVYLQNLRLSGMLHGRVIRPTSVGAMLTNVDENSIANIPGVIKIVSKGNWVGVVCEREEQAIRAVRDLKLTWEDKQTLPSMNELYNTLQSIASDDRQAANTGNVDDALSAANKTLKSTYYWPYQLHASIGPSCAVADVRSLRPNRSLCRGCG